MYSIENDIFEIINNEGRHVYGYSWKADIKPTKLKTYLFQNVGNSFGFLSDLHIFHSQAKGCFDV